ncbi:uncharacterized protein LOC110119086 [Ceratitis capitata]|uniref:uncharacterized protein LOC110119086 n=1 Tax=Ceratitis capitata TaxID=7213 RepID=UPI000A11FFA5|nr:uncharacterized protein LOC110119086 [Ceratitis capitata]XP_020718015.1 uncharacterized protein LOC110119086 [Ceratitis capitata]XP_020718016.1 uncharacterized protein LOC110119086 [Ceratitis capitata]
MPHGRIRQLKSEARCTAANWYFQKRNKITSLRNLTDVFFIGRQLKIQPTKSSATFFTSWTNEYRLELDVKVDDAKIPTVNNPTILGVTLYSLHSFTPLTTAIAAKLRNRNKILKALARSTWDKDKETLQATYKAIKEATEFPEHQLQDRDRKP